MLIRELKEYEVYKRDLLNIKKSVEDHHMRVGEKNRQWRGGEGARREEGEGEC